MALEHWLLELCENGDPVESWLTRAELVDSNNVMTTAVVASVCNAYPAAGGAAALAPLTSREAFGLDRLRMIKERDAETLNAMSNSANGRLSWPGARAVERVGAPAARLGKLGQSVSSSRARARKYGKSWIATMTEFRTDMIEPMMTGGSCSALHHRMDARKWELGERMPTSPDRFSRRRNRQTRWRSTRTSGKWMMTCKATWDASAQNQ